MSASLVSLFPDDADIAKTYLPMTQTALIKCQIFEDFIGILVSAVCVTAK